MKEYRDKLVCLQYFESAAKIQIGKNRQHYLLFLPENPD